MLKYRLKAILDIKAVVATKSPLDIKRAEGTYYERPSAGRPSGEAASYRRMKSEKRRESIESEKYDVNEVGEKMMKGRLYNAKSMKKALAIYPPIIVLLWFYLLTVTLLYTKLMGALNLS